jgi:thiamine-phosphate pyrophosphorylase
VIAGLRERLDAARLYLVCPDLPDRHVRAALDGGVQIVQLRMKSAPDAEILAVAARYRELCDANGALLILNDRPDLAVRAGADGVHVGQDDTAVERARALVGPDRLIGLSTHTPAQIEAAGEADVDYIGVGPVHATPTKPGRPAVGAALVRYAAAHARTPFFAIGGIDTATIGVVLDAGATRVAVVRAITEAADPGQAAARLRARLALEVGVGAT